MPTRLRQLTHRDIPAVEYLWRAATEQRATDIGVGSAREAGSVLDRPGAFGIGVFGDGGLLALAVAMPARLDDARSARPAPGLVHISSVATRPGHWGNGYARAQLWTQVSNRGARRLYEREGFSDLGRRHTSDRGETSMHYVRELPQPPMIGRRAARALCLDPDGMVLLMHWRDPVDGFCLWEPPGGGIEAGESPPDAVRREWIEETGLPVPDLVAGPTTVGRDVVWRGERVVADEDFFLARTDAHAPPLDTAGFTEAERVDGLGHEWIHWSAFDDLEDPVEPDLPAVLRRLDPRGPWATASRSGSPSA